MMPNHQPEMTQRPSADDSAAHSCTPSTELMDTPPVNGRAPSRLPTIVRLTDGLPSSPPTGVRVTVGPLSRLPTGMRLTKGPLSSLPTVVRLTEGP